MTDLTPGLVADYTRAFLATDAMESVRVGWDLRPSSPDIADTVIDANNASGRDAIVDGALPTPALALASLAAGQCAIMVTGSQIPADRNGLKFYTAQGEITKGDEGVILGGLGRDHEVARQFGRRIEAAGEAVTAYVARYVTGSGPTRCMGFASGSISSVLLRVT